MLVSGKGSELVFGYPNDIVNSIAIVSNKSLNHWRRLPVSIPYQSWLGKQNNRAGCYYFSFFKKQKETGKRRGPKRRVLKCHSVHWFITLSLLPVAKTLSWIGFQRMLQMKEVCFLLSNKRRPSRLHKITVPFSQPAANRVPSTFNQFIHIIIYYYIFLLRNKVNRLITVRSRQTYVPFQTSGGILCRRT